ncbi:HlyD family secretion protein, partial [Beijerinckia sp. L45]|uniref:HlyD family secretion protein n=1 Tax=Beijerinckia sp. L45 TaxID=1641855 RepID=UPI00131AB19A
ANPHRSRILPIVLVVLIAGGVFAYLATTRAPEAATRIGVVHETEIHVAPEVGGRLATVLVVAGQHVQKGEPLATLSIPELTASVEEAGATAAKSRADRDNVYAGVRKEQVDQSAENVAIAESNLVLARQQYVRTADLAAKNIESQQQLDQITASLRSAEGRLALARATFEQDKAGPTKEERASADAKVALADAAKLALEAKLAKTQLRAPMDGIVRILVATPGEVLAPGESIMTLAAGSERWFTFTIREDRLDRIRVGSRVALRTAKGDALTGQVTQVSPLGEFATWRAARAVGDHDLNSFLVRVDPIGPDAGLDPGMTVWLDPGPVSLSTASLAPLSDAPSRP